MKLSACITIICLFITYDEMTNGTAVNKADECPSVQFEYYEEGILSCYHFTSWNEINSCQFNFSVVNAIFLKSNQPV
jgi:hypothetical protein